MALSCLLTDTACTGGLGDSCMILMALLLSGLFLSAGTFCLHLKATMKLWTWPSV